MIEIMPPGQARQEIGALRAARDAFEDLEAERRKAALRSVAPLQREIVQTENGPRRLLRIGSGQLTERQEQDAIDRRDKAEADRNAEQRSVGEDHGTEEGQS